MKWSRCHRQARDAGSSGWFGASLLLVLAAMVFPAGSAHGETNAIGRIAALKGDVLIARDGQSLEAAKNGEVFLLDRISTREASKVKIRFIDDSVLTLSENSHLDIKEYFYDKTGENGGALFELVEGQLRALVGKGKKLKIHSPTAVAAARGTFFFVRVKSGDNGVVTQVFLLEGTLDVTSSNANIPGAIILGPGMSTTVKQGQPPSAPQPISEAQLKELLNCGEVGQGDLAGQ